MNAEKTIVKKAIDLIWQKPRLDKSLTIQLTRISPKNGFNDTGRVAWEVIETPLKDGYFHFYQIGDNYPGQFNLIAKQNQWYRLSEWCSLINLVIHTYDIKGRLIPMDNVYFIRLYNGNMIIAILLNNNINDLNEERIFMHFYANWFFSTERKDDSDVQMEYISLTETKKHSIIELLPTVQQLGSRVRGKTRLTYNGYLVDALDVRNLNRNDVFEVHYDLSIRRVVDIPISSLRTFKSTLDQKNKYLIHPPKDKVQCIDYRDDVDFFIYKRNKDGTIKGTYYYRNQEDAVRMVTHQDYSLPVPYVMSHVEHLDPNPDLDDFYIRLYIRDNDRGIPLIDDVNQIKSLYLMDDDKIYEAMVAVDSTIPEWTADHLEQSAYTAIMRSFLHEIDYPLAYKAFSYSQLIRTIADPNIILTEDPNGDYFELKEGLQEGIITVFEYDKHGLLLGWHHHEDYPRYYPHHPEAVFIEAYAGEGGSQLNQHIGNQPFELKTNTAYRFYLAKTEGDKVVSEWKDVTDDPRILVDGTTCVFNHKEIGELGLAWGDDKFLCWDLYNTADDGVIDFTLTESPESATPLIIQPGKVDIWLNGHSLVEGIDYYIYFPLVVIVNKEYIDDGLTKQHVVVRAMGYPQMLNGRLHRIAPRETGFVKYGYVSVNNHYDIHNDRLLRTTVDGGCYHPSVIPFDENGESPVSDYFDDGRPYSIETPYISLHGTLGIDMYDKMVKDYDLTYRISQYQTVNQAERQRDIPPAIKRKYKVYSPFLSRIVADLRYGHLRSPLPKTDIKTVDKIIEPYKRFLTVDPIIHGYDKHFVEVHPHCFPYYVDLTARDIAFLERVNKYYLDGDVEVTDFLRVKK